tara:strand:- start:3392 stop:3709 length:318 start_codon:yes stop_codon:yes gene_type:complete
MVSIEGRRSAELPPSGRQVSPMVKPAKPHTRFERARIIGARALQIGMGAPLNVSEDLLRDAFKSELISLYGVEEANLRFVLDPLKIALYEYDNHLIPIDVDPHLS